jgi:hypothetical protein
VADPVVAPAAPQAARVHRDDVDDVAALKLLITSTYVVVIVNYYQSNLNIFVTFAIFYLKTLQLLTRIQTRVFYPSGADIVIYKYVLVMTITKVILKYFCGFCYIFPQTLQFINRAGFKPGSSVPQALKL